MSGEMISDTTQDPELLLELLRQVRLDMDEGEDALASTFGDAVDGGALVGTLDEVKDAVDGSLAWHTGPVGPTNLGDGPLFLPHEQVVALLQSLLEQRADGKAGLVEETVKDSRSAGELPIFTDRSFTGTIIGPTESRLVGRFEKTDIRWVSSMLWHHIRRGGGDKHPFKPEPAPTVTLDERCRLVIVGDWASGLPRARAVAGEMRKELLAAEEAGIEAHAVHLGDTYYSGLPREIRERFLDCWPVHESEAGRFGSWAINGNHEMYSGGYGYFDHLLTDSRFEPQGESSWFVLESPAFRFIGLDTAWDETGLREDRDDCGLADPQGARVGELAAQDDRRLVLFSHHPLFSGDHPDNFLKNKLASVLDGGDVHAWFWGHEHVAEAFQSAHGVTYPRCVGHGGIPVHKPLVPPTGLTWRESKAIWRGVEHWTVFGFAVLDIDGASMKVRYLDEFGHESWSEELT